MADDGQVLAAKRCPIESHCCVATPSRVLGLPNGLPAVLVSPLAWTGGQFANESDYVLHMDSSDLQETREALDHFKSRSGVTFRNGATESWLTKCNDRIRLRWRFGLACKFSASQASEEA